MTWKQIGHKTTKTDPIVGTKRSKNKQEQPETITRPGLHRLIPS